MLDKNSFQLKLLGIIITIVMLVGSIVISHSSVKAHAEANTVSNENLKAYVHSNAAEMKEQRQEYMELFKAYNTTQKATLDLVHLLDKRQAVLEEKTANR